MAAGCCSERAPHLDGCTDQRMQQMLAPPCSDRFRSSAYQCYNSGSHALALAKCQDLVQNAGLSELSESRIFQAKANRPPRQAGYPEMSLSRETLATVRH